MVVMEQVGKLDRNRKTLDYPTEMFHAHAIFFLLCYISQSEDLKFTLLLS